MLTDPCKLIDETVDHLETLSVLFADEVDERIRKVGTSEPAVRFCKEVQSGIEALIPKLRAAKATQGATYYSGVCLSCDD